MPLQMVDVAIIKHMSNSTQKFIHTHLHIPYNLNSIGTLCCWHSQIGILTRIEAASAIEVVDVQLFTTQRLHHLFVLPSQLLHAGQLIQREGLLLIYVY